MATLVEVTMRKFLQALIIIAGFSAAIAAVKAEQGKPAIGNCYKIAAPGAPTICT